MSSKTKKRLYRVIFPLTAIIVTLALLTNCNKGQNGINRMPHPNSFTYKVIDSLGNILAVKTMKFETNEDFQNYFKNMRKVKSTQSIIVKSQIYYRKRGTNAVFRLLELPIERTVSPQMEQHPCGSPGWDYRSVATDYGVSGSNGGINLTISVTYHYTSAGQYVTDGYNYQIWGNTSPQLTTIDPTSMAGNAPGGGTTFSADLYGYYGNTTTNTTSGGIQGNLNGSLGFQGVGSVGAQIGANINGSLTNSGSSYVVDQLAISGTFDPCSQTMTFSTLTWQ